MNPERSFLMNQKSKFQKGDTVKFVYLKKPGTSEEVEWGIMTGQIYNIKKAGQIGAIAMNCSMDDLIYSIHCHDGYVRLKLECELKLC